MEFSSTEKKHAVVEQENPAQLRIRRDIESLGLLEMLESGIVLPQFEFAKAKHGIGSAIFRSEGKKLVKGAGSRAEIVAVVFEGAQRPPAFGPFRA